MHMRTRTKYQGTRAKRKATVTCQLGAGKVAWEGWQEPALEDQLLHLLLPFLIPLISRKMYEMILCQKHMPHALSNIRKLEMEAAGEAKGWMQTHFQWRGEGGGRRRGRQAATASIPFWTVVRGCDLSMLTYPGPGWGAEGG